MTGLGAFDITHPIGHGGIGDVWRAVHHTSGTPVAVKVIRPEHATDASRVESFRDEIRAVARLDHPHVVRIVDHGLVGPDAERQADGRVVAGSPFLVMELASGGSLAGPAPSTVDWSSLRAVLLDVLDALAHTHARGLVHRDVKPGNVLLCTRADARPGWKLSDFGIAHSLRDVRDTRSRGTLQYAAPEQLRGRWRELGPWTDLYALGNMALRLSTGVDPFGDLAGRALVTAQIFEPPRNTAPAIEVPDGWLAWIDRLTRKDWRLRPHSAAEAAHALRQLGEAAGEPVRLASSADVVTWLDSPTLADVSAPELPLPVAVPSSPVHLAVPDDWRPSTRARPTPLRGVGEALLEMRPAPMIGREAERDAVWEVLRDVAGSGRAAGVVLTGPRGIGKSRVASELVARAVELGVARAAVARHDADDEPGRPLRDCLVAGTTAWGLSGPPLRAHLAATLGADAVSVEAIAAWLDPDVACAFAAQRMALKTWLREMRGTSPAIIWLDDAGTSPFALAVAQDLVRAADLPVLVIVTADDGRSADATAPLVGSRWSRLTLRPWSPAERLAHASSLLDVDEQLALKLADDSQGHPAIAELLVRHYSRSGRLELGDLGFSLGGEDHHGAALDVAAARLAPFVESHDAGAALELAAALGPTVPLADWTHLCPSDPTALVEPLLDAGLALRSPGGWRFETPVLRAALERRARGAGRWADHHAACAELLADGVDHRTLARRGRHLLAAGRESEAIDDLLTSTAHSAAMEVGYAEVACRLDDAETALEARAVPDDPRWAELLHWRGVMHLQLGNVDGAERCASRLTALAERLDDDDARGAARLLACLAAHSRGDEEGARAHVEAAVPLLQAAGSRRLAWAYFHQGRMGYAAADKQQATLRALRLFEAAGDVHGAGDCWSSLASVRLRLAPDEDVLGPLDQAEASYREVGSPFGLAEVYNLRGEVHRARGEMAEAQRAYSDAVRLHDQMSSVAVVFPLLNLALVALDAGQPGAASQPLARAQQIVERRGFTRLLPSVHFEWALHAATLEDWERVAASLQRGEQAMEARYSDDDAKVLERVASLAASGGLPETAQRAWRLAADHWRGLGDHANAARVAALCE